MAEPCMILAEIVLITEVSSWSWSGVNVPQRSEPANYIHREIQLSHHVQQRVVSNSVRGLTEV